MYRQIILLVYKYFKVHQVITVLEHCNTIYHLLFNCLYDTGKITQRYKLRKSLFIITVMLPFTLFVSEFFSMDVSHNHTTLLNHK